MLSRTCSTRATQHRKDVYMSAHSLLIIDSDSQSRKAIADSVHTEGVHVVGAVAALRDGLRIMAGDPPSIVVLEARELEQGMREVSDLVSCYPHLSVFVTAREKNPDWILRLIRAGATEYLTRPVEADELVDAIRKVARLRPVTSAKRPRQGKLISFYNPCAGMGTTTLAVNTAAALAASGKKVVLADLNLINGDVCSFLDLAPRYTLSNVAAKQGQIDASFLASVLVQSCNFHVLCGPSDLRESMYIDGDAVLRVLATLRSGFDYVIVDTGGHLFGTAMDILAVSDDVVYTTVLSLPALRTARRYITTLEREGVGKDRVKLVVNRYLPRDEIRLGDAEKVLECKACLTVPNAYLDVRGSINRAVPLVISERKSPVSVAIERLAAILARPDGDAALKEVI